MPRDKSLSHERIIKAALDEFRECGYDRASMRSIGRRCGLTAAALYRHFDSKEAMFDALVKPAADDIYEWMEHHMADSVSALAAISPGGSQSETDAIWRSTEIDMMRDLVYPRMSEYSMLINKAVGSKYEGFLNVLVEKAFASMWPYMASLRKAGIEAREISEAELKMLITAYCTALFEPVMHNYSLDDAVGYLATVETFFMPGWRALLGFS